MTVVDSPYGNLPGGPTSVFSAQPYIDANDFLILPKAAANAAATITVTATDTTACPSPARSP